MELRRGQWRIAWALPVLSLGANVSAEPAQPDTGLTLKPGFHRGYPAHGQLRVRLCERRRLLRVSR